MRFREHQASARTTTRRLVVLFVFTIALTVLGVNLALWLAWRLVMVDMLGTPRLFYEVNTAVTLLFVLGGWWLESLQLQKGGAHVAELLGGREVTKPRNLAERRFRNVVHEMTIASGLPMPRVFVLDREEAINAFASGWTPEDSAISVTHGALLRLTRDELQGVVAHEFGHIQSGDTRLNMRLIGMVFGLQMVYTLGQTLAAPNDKGQHNALAVLGWALMGAGSIGWLAGRLLKAAVSRQREFLADAHAVQYTRLPKGLGQALLKVAGQRTQGQRMHHRHAELVSHLLLSSDVWVRGGWLATHPPLAERIRRLLGRVPPDLPAEPVAMADEADPGVSAHAALPVAALATVHPAPVATQATQGVKPGMARQNAGAANATPQAPPNSLPNAATTATASPPPDALALPQWSPPSAIRLAVLAFLVPGPSSPEHAAWGEVMGSASATVQQLAQVALACVWALPPRQRQPWLEHTLHRARSLPPDQQAQTLRHAVALVPPEGPAPLQTWLAVCLMRHTLTAADPAALPPLRALGLPDAALDIWRMSLALGQLVAPAGSGLCAGQPLGDHHAQVWAKGVMTGLELAVPQEGADETGCCGWAWLPASLLRLAELGPLQQPALVKHWVQAVTAQGHEPPQPWADALRSICLLIGSPMPPVLMACFDVLPNAFSSAMRKPDGRC